MTRLEYSHDINCSAFKSGIPRLIRETFLLTPKRIMCPCMVYFKKTYINETEFSTAHVSKICIMLLIVLNNIDRVYKNNYWHH